MAEPLLGQSIVEFGDLLYEISRHKDKTCPARDRSFSRSSDLELKERHETRILELRAHLNTRLAGLVGNAIGKAGPWPPGDHLRRRVRFVGDAADAAGANQWWKPGLACEYFARYPAPRRGEAAHVPYLFVQIRAGGKGLCGRPTCAAQWHPDPRHPWRFMYGFSSYEEIGSTGTPLSPSARMAMRSAVVHSAPRLLRMRKHLEHHERGGAVRVNGSQATGQGFSNRLSDLGEDDLRAWVLGLDPGMQAELGRDALMAMSDREILDHVGELFDYARGFGERVWELSVRTERPSVFLSYRRADLDRHGDRQRTIGTLVEAIEEQLESPTVFWDHALENGDDYRLELTKRAESSWLFVALRGPRYVPWRDPEVGGSDWCRNEYHAASVGGADFLEVRLDDAPSLDDRERDKLSLQHRTTTLEWRPGGPNSVAEVQAIADAVGQRAARGGPDLELVPA